MDFVDAIKICFRKYVDGGGRAPRSEYWYFVLFGTVGQACLEAISDPLSLAFSIAIFVPTIAVSIRRLHDVDRIGYWMLLGFVPIVGWALLLIWTCSRGTDGPNRFGPSPLTPDGVPASG